MNKELTVTEKSYIEACVDALAPKGDVLEIGFGHSAEYIQKHFKPNKHVLLITDANLRQEAEKWSSSHKHVKIISQLPDTPDLFDAILFHSPKVIRETINQERGKWALQKGKETLSYVTEHIPHLHSIRYKDDDIDSFYKAVGQDHPVEFCRFLSELAANRQISEEQYKNCQKKYRLAPHEQPMKAASPDPLFPMLMSCLQLHMRPRSLFSALAYTPISKYEDPLFFEHIITNPEINYEENLFPIKEPWDGYPFKEALIFVIEKLA